MVSKSEFLYAGSTAVEYHSLSAVIRDGGWDADVDVWLVYPCILEQLVPGHRFFVFLFSFFLLELRLCPKVSSASLPPSFS